MAKKGGEPPSKIEGQHDSSPPAISEPIAVRIINAPPTPDDQKQNYQNSYRLQRKSFIVGMITLVVLIGYTTINYWLYQETVNTNQANQRARIFVTSMGMQKKSGSPPPEFPKSVVEDAAVIVNFENSGETPATNVLQMTSACIAKYDRIPANFSYRDLNQLQHLPALIPPRSPFNTYIPVSVDYIDDAIKYKRRLFVWGTITYRDIFKQSHITDFCAVYEGAVKPADSNSITYNFEQCPTHNCADEECPKEWGPADQIDCDNAPWANKP